MPQYRSPDELNITPGEHAALVRLMSTFRQKPVPLVPSDDVTTVHAAKFRDIEKVEDFLGFAMNYGASMVDEPKAYNCGCAACIGGHMSLAMQGQDTMGTCFTKEALEIADRYVTDREYHAVLGQLFYPRVIYSKDWSQITARMAAEAIENVLTIGRPKWKSIGQAHGLMIDPDEDE